VLFLSLPGSSAGSREWSLSAPGDAATCKVELLPISMAGMCHSMTESVYSVQCTAFADA
jgi:hypothetical protein